MNYHRIKRIDKSLYLSIRFFNFYGILVALECTFKSDKIVFGTS